MKKFLIGLIVLLIGTIFAFNIPKDKHDILLEETKESAIDKEIREAMAKMSLEEKIGQMFIIDFKDNYLTDELKEELTLLKPGGVIFFKDNISTYQKTTKVIQDMQDTATIPLFITLDQEGGRVQRITDLPDLSLTKIPSMQKLGALNDFNLTYETGKVIGEEIRLFGFNLDFAPVVDVLSVPSNVIGDRSFGSNPSLVSEQGIYLNKGLNEAGVIGVYKHFPGHGSTQTDSHYDLPVLNETKEELEQSNLIPFKKAIEAKADMIMVGHLAIPNLTNDKTPASLSKEIITNLLKKEMGFQGLVITDSLKMQALTKNYSEKEIYTMAINAGVDILLMPQNFENAINLIKESIQEGTITVDQIDASVKKILLLKTTKLSTENLALSEVDLEHHQEIINKIN